MTHFKGRPYLLINSLKLPTCGNDLRMSRVRKALIPVAGLGTRFLPATKSIPKEMLPIVDKPGILYAVEEAAQAGIEEIVLVQGRGKNCIEDFFDLSFELEKTLEQREKTDLIKTLKSIRSLAKVISIRQMEPLGLGHAVLCGQSIIQNEPFAVLLPDELMVGDPNVTEELVPHFLETGESVVAIMDVPKPEVNKYGIADVQEICPGKFKVQSLVEKPNIDEAPSSWALPGRYIFSPEIFKYLERTTPGAGGEIQLTDAMIQLAQNEGLNAATFQAKRYDTGNKLGFIQANVELALQHPEIGKEFREYLKTITKAELNR